MIRFLIIVLAFVASYQSALADERPNILWITIEDWGPDLSCYGTKGIQTPHVDKLAAQGVRYDRAFTTSPVCSTSRSALMTGFHQNYIGAHQHREENPQPLPHGIRPIPHLMADAGYFTCLMSKKVDCNFLPNKKEKLFMGSDWKERKPGQPFFARITFQGTHRPWHRDPVRPIKIDDVELPPQYADTPFIRRDWANGLEAMQLVDRQIGKLLKRLDEEGLAENTLVFFIGDHGVCNIRGKQFLYDEGTRIPMVMRWPGKIEPNQINDEMISALDICATVIDVGKASSPVSLHGRSLLKDEVNNRKYLFAARDKMGGTHDAMRSIRSKDFKLILNLMPGRPYCQLSQYKEGAYPPLAEMNVLHLKGELTSEQDLFFADHKPKIEMFDLRNDPYELKNIADDPKHEQLKATLLLELNRWRTEVINDQGVSDAFVANDIFPDSAPISNVAQWVQENRETYNYVKSGCPPWFPTRSLAQWEEAVELWRPYVFRGPGEDVKRPTIPFTKFKKAPKNKGKVNTKGAETSDPPRPNVIVFLVDDMGVMDTSVPFLTDSNGKPKRYPLNDFYRTPNMEQFAKRGIRFSQFYAMSVCSPTRVSIMTGQNSARHHTTQWIKSEENNHGEFGPRDWNWRGPDVDTVTLPRLLRANGYRTIHVGKGHFGPFNSAGEDPLNLGFEINVGGRSIGAPGSYFGKDHFGNPIAGRKPRKRDRAVPHLDKYHGTETHLTEALTNEALHHVTLAVEKKQPFFLYLSHYAVHGPHQSDPRFAEHYVDSGQNKRTQNFATLIQGMDKSLGDVMQRVNELGIGENTLILFLGDNGSDAPIGHEHAVACAAPLRGKKGSHYEGGVRVPFIAGWATPDSSSPAQKDWRAAAGKIQNQMANVCDLTPTICELTSTEIPDGHISDGQTMRQLFSGHSDPDHSQQFLMHFPHEHRSSYFTLFRDGDWKVVYQYLKHSDANGATYQLFNLADDPFEQTNLADKQPDKLKSMMDHLSASLEQHRAQYPLNPHDEKNVLRPQIPQAVEPTP